MTLLAAEGPETQALTHGQYDLVQYSVAVAGFALLAYAVYSLVSRGELSSRYRPATYTGAVIGVVATVSYLTLYLKVDSGYALNGDMYVPNGEALHTIGPRYMDWTVTVPLLTVELLAVTALAGRTLRNVRASTVAAAFLMIVTGYLGAFVLGQPGRETGPLVGWGLVSTAFYAYLYVALIGAVRSSRGRMSDEAYTSLRNATTVLLGAFGVYPLVYAVPVLVDVTPAWTVTMQVAYSAADVLAKVGFGVLVHKVAKLRTAEDVLSGEETHPEPVWVSNVKHSAGVQPVIKGGGQPEQPGAGTGTRRGRRR